jgi:hypothetical protein
VPSEGSGSDLESLLPELISIQESIRKLEAARLALEERVLRGLFGSPPKIDQRQSMTGDEKLVESQAPAEKLVPRLVTHTETDRPAVRLASGLMDALVKYLIAVEEQILSETTKVIDPLQQEVEEIRHNVAGLTGPLYTQLEQQQEELASSRKLMDGIVGRLDRQRDALLSLSEAQERQGALLQQLVHTLIRLAPLAGVPYRDTSAQL